MKKARRVLLGALTVSVAAFVLSDMRTFQRYATTGAVTTTAVAAAGTGNNNTNSSSNHHHGFDRAINGTNGTGGEGGGNTTMTTAAVAENRSAAICAWGKGQEAYLDEWVDYHSGLGFDHFYVYDDSRVLAQWGSEKGRHVTVVNGSDSDAYLQHCTEQFGHHHTWLGFFGVEDFLILKPLYDSVVDFLSEHCERGVIGIHRAVFGSSGRHAYAPLPVTKRFQYRIDEPVNVSPSVKSIVRVRDLNLSRTLDADDKRGNFTDLFLGKQPGAAGTILAEGNITANPNRPPPIITNAVAVFHSYPYKSLKEYTTGGYGNIGQFLYGSILDGAILDEQGPGASTGGGTTPMKDDASVPHGTVHDDTAWEAIKKYDPRYEMYDLDLAGPAPRYPSRWGTDETVALCAVAKHEEAYIDEWVDYHHALGFSDIYIYDNSEAFDLQQWGMEQGPHVHVQHLVGIGMQTQAYARCAKESNHTWVAFFDVDEYLILKRHKNIVDMLHHHVPSGALSLRWIMAGTSEREVYQPLPTSLRFQEFFESFGHKSIARREDLDLSKGPMVHYQPLQPGVFRRDTNGTIVNGINKCPQCPVDVAAFFHYRFRSYKENLLKSKRGRAGGGGLNKKVVVNDIIKAEKRNIPLSNFSSNEAWKKIKEYNPNYALFEQFV